MNCRLSKFYHAQACETNTESRLLVNYHYRWLKLWNANDISVRGVLAQSVYSPLALIRLKNSKDFILFSQLHNILQSTWQPNSFLRRFRVRAGHCYCQKRPKFWLSHHGRSGRWGKSLSTRRWRSFYHVRSTWRPSGWPGQTWRQNFVGKSD